jgi:hypothetical protein
VKISILNRVLVAAVLSAAWLVGMSMPANAQGQGQQEHQQKQNKKQQKKQRPRKAQKQQKQQQKGQQQARQQQQRGQNKEQQQRAEKVQSQRQPRAVANNNGDNGFHGNGNNGNHYGRIPDNSYRAHFGHDHSFRMVRPQMVNGYNRFQYSGYWFGFNQPWPSGWSYNDNVYVEYVGGGYYLCNPRHPGIQITLNIF